MRVAAIGECMIELRLPREGQGKGRVGFAGDTLNAAVYLKRSAPEIAVAYVTALGTDPLSARMLAFFETEAI
jgi:2-dehydro-3-deoxygluconokinase